MKKILGMYSNTGSHWVGDGFPVRITVLATSDLGRDISARS